MLETDDEKRRFLASGEFGNDPEYMKSMDEAYHNFMQPQYFGAWRRFCVRSIQQQIEILMEEVKMYGNFDAAVRQMEDGGEYNDRCEFCGSLLFKKELDEDGKEFVIECRNETCTNYLKDVSK